MNKGALSKFNKRKLFGKKESELKPKDKKISTNQR